MQLGGKAMKNPLGIYKGLHHEIYVMAFASFINCFGEFITLFFSLYLTQKLGYTTATAGIMVSALFIAHIPGSLLGGKLCDRFGRKGQMIWSQTAMAVCYLTCGFFLTKSFAPYLIILGKFFDGITDPAREALEADITGPKDRQAAFSLIYFAINVAYATGPLLAAFLYTTHPSWLFWGSGLLQLVAMIIVLVLVSETLPTKEVVSESKKTETAEQAETGSTLKAFLARPQLIWFSFGILLCNFAYSQTTFSLPLETESLFGVNGAKLYGTIVTVNAGLILLANPLVLAWSKKRNEIRSLVMAAILFTIAFTLFAFIHIPWQFYLLTVIFTLGELLVNNNEAAYRFNNIPINFRGRLGAVVKMFWTAGKLLGPLFGGMLLSAFSYHGLWLAAGTGASIAVLCFAMLGNKKFQTEKILHKDAGTKS
jgi:MFS family permease